MFEALSDKLSGILDRLTRRGALTAADVDAAAREVRRALLEADVALDVVRDFIAKLKERAVGVEVIKSVTPGQMIVKIVHDQLVETLGATADPIDLNAAAPVPIMLVGLQGAGKTTAVAGYVADGHERLNRDERGGTLRGLARALGERLAAGATRVVLDNTYVTRAQRREVIDEARAEHQQGTDTRSPACRPEAGRRRERHGRQDHPERLPQPVSGQQVRGCPLACRAGGDPAILLRSAAPMLSPPPGSA